ncbi:hypothetical protein ACGFJT_44330 [Actinomadura geliboluensis]|uniref:hypothetical protein n=1 Tax=Actinomadura geliboluensis TaxID=882440 RepID=UPI0037183882
MSRRVDLPDEDRVRTVMAEVIEQAHERGRRPAVTALAAALGLNNTTFWRHFPDIARQVVDQAKNTAPASGQDPSRHAKLTEDLARLKRDNAQLKHDLQRAKAVIQRLALENEGLRSRSSNVIPFERSGPANPGHEPG